MRILTLAAIAALAAFPGRAVAQTAGLEGVEYTLLDIAPMAPPDEVPPPQALPEYFINQQLEATHAAARGRPDDALATGWLDSNVYVRIRPGEVSYFIRRPNPVSVNQEATHVCRITVRTATAGVVMPDALPFLGSSRGLTCEGPPGQFVGRLKDAGLWLGSEQTTDRTQMTAPDGTALSVEHRGGSVWPTPSGREVNEVRTLYQMPVQWRLSRSIRQRAWIIERSDGTYDLAVRFNIQDDGERAGCIVRDRAGSFPNGAWITPELREWCVARDREFTPDTPAYLIPRPPPPMPRP